MVPIESKQRHKLMLKKAQTSIPTVFEPEIKNSKRITVRRIAWVLLRVTNTLDVDLSTSPGDGDFVVARQVWLTTAADCRPYDEATEQLLSVRI